MGQDETGRTIAELSACVDDALASLPPAAEGAPEAIALRDLSVRARKLAQAWPRPACVGLFGPSQAGKSFLVGALLSHELGSLKVRARSGEYDFLKEINPAKGVESTGVVTRFSTRPPPVPLAKNDFECTLLSLETALESLATGFLVECTSPPASAERIDEAIATARAQAGPAAPPAFLAAWEAVWHELGKKYQDRHPYLSALQRHQAFARGAWKADVRTVQGWLVVYALLWGGPGYAPDVDALFRALLAGLEAVGFAPRVEVRLEHVRASSEGVSVIDAACLNSLGDKRSVVTVYAPDAGREVAIEPGVLSALIAEIRLALAPAQGSLLERADLLDFPGGRALKGINGFGQADLSTGKLTNAIEVYKRGKLTFLFEQYALDREITVLCLCSPGPTKPEAVQLQSQVESWIKIRHGAPLPQSPAEVERPSLFLALTKFDMSLGALRSDNARDRWDSRVQEACVDFWARSQNSWLYNWGGKGRAFNNMFWIRNPYADQMKTLRQGDPDYALIRQGYMEARAVLRHIKDPAAKWAAVEGDDAAGLTKSGVPLLAAALREKLSEDVKSRELTAEAQHIHEDLLAVLRALTPSKDEEEERSRVRESAEALVSAIRREMTKRCTGAVFGELMVSVIVPDDALEEEVRKAWEQVSPMSIKTSDKVKKVLSHVLRWWTNEASARARRSSLDLPQGLVDTYVREVCGSKQLLPVLGNAVYPYFSRSTVDPALIASIMQVKVGDALLDLFQVEAARTPPLPVRLSYSEAPDGRGDDGPLIDWGSVDLSEDAAAAARALDVEIVFAGSSRYKKWSSELPAFYLANKGAKIASGGDDPKVKRLVAVLGQVEKIHVGQPG